MISRVRSWKTCGLAMAVVLCAGLATLGATTVSGASAKPAVKAKTPTPYYLALGDSLSVGYQPSSSAACPVGPPTGCTQQGYTNDLYKIYKKRIKHLKLEELGCPGESTATMISGGICNYSEGNQLAQAEYFIKNNDVAFVTITLGANDVDGCANYILHNPSDPNYSADVSSCVENGANDATYNVSADGIAGIHSNLPTILSGLDNAIATSTSGSKGAPVFGMNYYDPFLALYVVPAYSGPTGFAEGSVSLLQNLNGELASDYGAASAAVADVQATFDSTDSSVPTSYTTPSPGGFGSNSDPLNVQAICAWTWECVDANIHANNTGYASIATSFAAVMGYLG